MFRGDLTHHDGIAARPGLRAAMCTRTAQPLSEGPRPYSDRQSRRSQGAFARDVVGALVRGDIGRAAGIVGSAISKVLVAEEFDLGVVGGWSAEQGVGGGEAAEVQVEEGRDVG